MASQPLAILAATGFLLFVGCKKDLPHPDSCARLKDGLFTYNATETGSEINRFIRTLPSPDNSAENLDRLAETIASACNISATVLCFNCIDTLPAQSEIRISFTSADSVVNRTIDISHTPENKMVFVNVHE